MINDSVIPVEAYDQNGDLDTNEAYVLNKWQTDFENLYHSGEGNYYDPDFQRHALSHKALLEDKMLDPLYDCNMELKHDISMQEFEKNNNER